MSGTRQRAAARIGMAEQPCLFPGDALHAGWPWGALEPMTYDLIMADPPWRFELDTAEGEAKSAQAQYGCMSIDDIAALPVAGLARADCLLWLWATAPLLDQQIAVMRRWGFTFKSAGAWDKRRWGTGYVWRSRAEFVLLGTIGKPSIDGRAVCNLIEGGARRHSEKPVAAYLQAERMMPAARRLELFSRTNRKGWDVWGNEAGKFGSAESATEGA